MALIHSNGTTPATAGARRAGLMLRDTGSCQGAPCRVVGVLGDLVRRTAKVAKGALTFAATTAGGTKRALVAVSATAVVASTAAIAPSVNRLMHTALEGVSSTFLSPILSKVGDAVALLIDSTTEYLASGAIAPQVTHLAATSGDTTHMTWLQTIVLSIVQGLTEFLPVSSSGHLRIVSQLLWGHDAGASFTAVVQLGTEAAVLVFFAKDIWRIISAWFRGLFNPAQRGQDYRMGWMVIVGTIPVGIVGFLLKDFIRDSFRNLWITATVLILFSFVFIFAERVGRHQRTERDLTMKDAILMGLAQCLALIPGVSRSGGTVSAGLLLNQDRETATRFSFLLAIPAVLASGLFSLPDAFHPTDGQVASGAQLLVGTLVAFGLGYVTIAWLLRFVANNSFAWFAAYRIPVGLAVMVLLGTGVMAAQ